MILNVRFPAVVGLLAVMLNTPCPAFITTSVMEGQSITNCYAQSLCASDETGESFFT